MTNLDKMKQSLIVQIEQMDVETFDNFANILQYNLTEKDSKLLSCEGLFKCEDCSRVFGDCGTSQSMDICVKRFKEYTLREVG